MLKIANDLFEICGEKFHFSRFVMLGLADRGKGFAMKVELALEPRTYDIAEGKDGLVSDTVV